LQIISSKGPQTLCSKHSIGLWEQLFLIATAAEVHVIEDATLKDDTWNVFNAGDIEMFLIQLSGHHTLLNSQLGQFLLQLPS